MTKDISYIESPINVLKFLEEKLKSAPEEAVGRDNLKESVAWLLKHPSNIPKDKGITYLQNFKKKFFYENRLLKDIRELGFIEYLFPTDAFKAIDDFVKSSGVIAIDMWIVGMYVLALGFFTEMLGLVFHEKYDVLSKRGSLDAIRISLKYAGLAVSGSLFAVNIITELWKTSQKTQWATYQYISAGLFAAGGVIGTIPIGGPVIPALAGLATAAGGATSALALLKEKETALVGDLIQGIIAIGVTINQVIYRQRANVTRVEVNNIMPMPTSQLPASETPEKLPKRPQLLDFKTAKTKGNLRQLDLSTLKKENLRGRRK